jgi:hypothetical protein
MLGSSPWTVEVNGCLESVGSTFIALEGSTSDLAIYQHRTKLLEDKSILDLLTTSSTSSVLCIRPTWDLKLSNRGHIFSRFGQFSPAHL